MGAGGDRRNSCSCSMMLLERAFMGGVVDGCRVAVVVVVTVVAVVAVVAIVAFEIVLIVVVGGLVLLMVGCCVDGVVTLSVIFVNFWPGVSVDHQLFF